MRTFSISRVSAMFFAVMVAAFTAVLAEPAPNPATGDWGNADASGVQMRLQAAKRDWQSLVGSTETPTFTLDLRNTGSKTVPYFGMDQECLIEVDMHWYIWSKPIPINMPPRQLFPGKEMDGALTIQLTNDWIQTDLADWGSEPMDYDKKITYLKLTPGSHTLRVRFRPGSIDAGITTTSNPVDFGVQAASSTSVNPPGAH